MHLLTEYTEIDPTQWSALVGKSSTGTWFQQPEAYVFYARMPELLEPFVIGVTGDGLRVTGDGAKETLRAVCVGYVTKERSRLKQFFTRRAIIPGGVCLADDCSQAEAEALLVAVRSRLERKAIYIETRNYNDYSRWKEAFAHAGFAYQPHLNFHIDCSDRSAMDARLSDVRRRQLKKAAKSGATVKSEGITEAEVQEFYRILSRLYKTKVKSPLFPLEFFLTFLRNETGKYLLVQYEGKVIGGMMCPIFANPERSCIYEWYVCGLDSDYKEQYPSVMATYAAMDYAASNGIKRFDVMGAGQPGVPYGVRDFKSEFGGTLVENGRFVSVQNRLLFRIGSWAVKLIKMC